MAAVEGSYIGRYFVLGLDILDIVCILDELSFMGRGTALLFGWNRIVTSVGMEKPTIVFDDIILNLPSLVSLSFWVNQEFNIKERRQTFFFFPFPKK